jgi:hypothetical protein
MAKTEMGKSGEEKGAILGEMKTLGYLASPYGHPDVTVMEQRWVRVCEVAARLVLADFNFYCPIAHTHPIADYGDIPLADHEIWLPFDEPLLLRCDELWVVGMKGWQESKGLAWEMQKFREIERPIYFIDPDNPVTSLLKKRAL